MSGEDDKHGGAAAAGEAIGSRTAAGAGAERCPAGKDRAVRASSGEPGEGTGGDVPWKRPESVLVVVHSDDGQILLLQRRDDPTFWQSVTGSLEPGERPAEAARRELFEETALALAVHDLGLRTTFEIRPPWRARYAPGVTHNLEHAFTARTERACEVTLSEREHLAFLWLPAREALERASSPTNREPIRRLLTATK